MRGISLVGFLAVSALAQTNGYVSSGPAIKVPGYEINSGTGELASGVRVRYKSVATPDGSSLNLIATGMSVADDRVHRFVIDKTTQSYFGYDLLIGPANPDNQFQAVFQPLTGADKMVGDISENPSLKPMPLPKYPPPQFVRNGDIIALDLMVSPDGSRKITDYIEVLAPPGSPVAEAATANAEAKDFTVDDGPVTFNLSPDWLWVNGQQFEGQTAFTGKPGATLWIAIPGHGRYIVSLAPHEGFLRSGAMRGDTISFHDGDQRYAVRFNGPIARGGQAWNLYVLHDAAYEPKPGMQNAAAGGVDRLDNLWPSH